MNRQQWKAFYRDLRVHRREFLKAEFDGLIFGFGAVRISADRDLEHVPHDQLIDFERGELWPVTDKAIRRE